MPHSRPSKKLTGLGGGPIHAKKIGVCRREGQLAKLEHKKVSITNKQLPGRGGGLRGLNNPRNGARLRFANYRVSTGCALRNFSIASNSSGRGLVVSASHMLRIPPDVPMRDAIL